MTGLLSDLVDGLLPWGSKFRVLFAVGHNDDGTNKRAEKVTFAKAGGLAVATGAGRYPLTYTATITGIVLACNTAPTGAAVICDLDKNGVTCFTTQSARPSIPAGGFRSNVAVPDIVSLTATDYLSVDIDQVGSTVAGSDLTVVVFLAA